MRPARPIRMIQHVRQKRQPKDCMQKTKAVSSDSNHGVQNQHTLPQNNFTRGHASWEKGKTLLAQKEVDCVFIHRPRPSPRQGRRLGPPQVWNLFFLAPNASLLGGSFDQPALCLHCLLLLGRTCLPFASLKPLHFLVSLPFASVCQPSNLSNF